jgi:hypothetical protein
MRRFRVVAVGVGLLVGASLTGASQAQQADTSGRPAGTASAVASSSPAAAATAILSEVQKLKAENLKLRYALAEQQRASLQRELQGIEQDRRRLEAEFRAALGATPDQSFDWTTLVFLPAAPPETPEKKEPKS